MNAYVITNLVNDKQYVGITSKTVEDRWKSHLKLARQGRPTILYNAIRKYGVENFLVEQVASAKDWNDLRETEIRLIEQYGTFLPGGYNMTLGGDGVLGWAPSIETLKKRSIASKNISADTRAKLAAASRGRIPTAETRAKISAAHKGKIVTPETRAKIAAAARVSLTGQRPGEKHPLSKLTDSNRWEIFEEKLKGANDNDLANKYGVCTKTVRNAARFCRERQAIV